MALQSFKHGVPFPAWPTGPSNIPPALTNTYQIDAADEKAALIISASVAKSIHKVHFHTQAVTTGDTVDVRVETVDSAANGDPTGTLWATNTNGAVVVASSDDDVWKTATLTADAALAIGDVVALVIVNGGGGGNMLLSGWGGGVSGAEFPYGDAYAGSWAKQGRTLLIVPEYSDGSFAPIFGYTDFGALITSTSFNSGSATNRRGNIFQLPFPARANGCWAWVDADGAFTVKLYDSDGTTVLATTAAITIFQRQTNSGGLMFFPFTATASLAKNTNYRLAVVPSSVTSLSTYELNGVSAAMLDMFPGGQNCYASVYTSGAWVETTARRGYLGVLLDAFDDGVSAGSLLLNPGLRGGLG